MTTLVAEPFDGSLAQRLAGQEAADACFYWLGQAGFLLAFAGRRILIDPYLSDSLAEKYRGKAFSHERMMPAPISTAELGKVDVVLVTHHHTDHMDPATLAPIAAANPDCRFVVPRASLDEAQRRIGVDHERLIALDAGEGVAPFDGCRVTAICAAHETLERSAEGWHRFLGYVLELGAAKLYHSGDTIPFDGLAEEVAAHAPDIALLPVNGRRAELTAAGIAGNLTLSEAIDLAGAIGAGHMIGHHYGMFAFNTAPPEAIDQAAAAHTCRPQIHRARTGVEYRIS
jgi:L-ascorbate metabolism protein UlaG (beta-lactamase superfamily)